MTPVDQTLFGDGGNCFAACLASLLDVQLSLIPPIGDDPRHERLNDWLAGFGLYAITLSGGQEAGGARWIPAGLHILGGRSIGGPHAVVAHGDHIVHDPNPRRGGLITREDYTLLVQLVPGRIV